jgi:hypothetical protein
MELLVKEIDDLKAELKQAHDKIDLQRATIEKYEPLPVFGPVLKELIDTKCSNCSLPMVIDVLNCGIRPEIARGGGKHGFQCYQCFSAWD